MASLSDILTTDPNNQLENKMAAKEMILDQKAKAQEVVDSFDAILGQLDIDLKASYDQGVADGKASMGNPSDKIYDQAEVDALLKPLQDSLVSKEAQISGMQAQIDQLSVDVDAKVAAAKKDMASQIKAAFDAQQASESASEQSLGSMLDSLINPPA